MSIEEHFAKEANSKKPRHFRDVAGKLMNERESEDSRPWKWEEEITESDWTEILATLEHLRLEGLGNRGLVGHWNNFVELGAIIHIFDSTINLNIVRQVMEYLERIIKKNQEIGNLSTTAYLHLIFPSIKYEISDDTIKERKAHRAWRISKGDAHLIGSDQLPLKILIPSEIINIPPSVWDMKEWNNSENMTGFANVFGRNRLVDPPPQISIDDSLWEKMKVELEVLRNNNAWVAFCRMAFNMRVLAAHKVEVTENGIEFIDKQPAKLDVALPPRPIRKKKI